MTPVATHVESDNIIRAYYDHHVLDKIKDYVDGNRRVTLARQTIRTWASRLPTRILEVGCGIGATSFWMSQLWSQAHVCGIDISRSSLDVAQRLFASPQLDFKEGPLVSGLMDGTFDLIVLMDVYEHIRVAERPILHAALRDLCSKTGRIILSFPTPRHLHWIRQHCPHRLQPVDEDISVPTVVGMARETATELLFYQEVDVWKEGDYAHAVLGRGRELSVLPLPPESPPNWKDRVRAFLQVRAAPLVPIIRDLLRLWRKAWHPRQSDLRAVRIARVHHLLGHEYYPVQDASGAMPL